MGINRVSSGSNTDFADEKIGLPIRLKWEY